MKRLISLFCLMFFMFACVGESDLITKSNKKRKGQESPTSPNIDVVTDGFTEIEDDKKESVCTNQMTKHGPLGSAKDRELIKIACADYLPDRYDEGYITYQCIDGLFKYQGESCVRGTVVHQDCQGQNIPHGYIGATLHNEKKIIECNVYDSKTFDQGQITYLCIDGKIIYQGENCHRIIPKNGDCYRQETNHGWLEFSKHSETKAISCAFFNPQSFDKGEILYKCDNGSYRYQSNTCGRTVVVNKDCTNQKTEHGYLASAKHNEVKTINCVSYDFSRFDAGLISYKCDNGVFKYQSQNCSKTDITKIQAPYYFMAIHNEPFHDSNNSNLMPESIAILRKMITKADGYKIKLTIMLSAQMIAKFERNEIMKWEQNGHEIAAHHHSIYHGNWDGYTDIPMDEVNKQRKIHLCPDCKIETHLGNLNDYMKELYSKFNGEIVSGCVNDERDKREMPDDIIYDTCAGYSNQYKMKGKVDADTNSEKGINEFIMTASVNGIDRFWLGHAQILSKTQLEAAVKSFKITNYKKVYGAVVHSSPLEYESFSKYMDHLHQMDATAAKSKTIKQIMEEELLPVEEVDIAMKETGNCDFNKDGKIDDFEKKMCEGGLPPISPTPPPTPTPIVSDKCDFNKDGKVDDFEKKMCSGTTVPQSKLAKPVVLAVTNTANSININWSAVNGAEKYVVMWSTTTYNNPGFYVNGTSVKITITVSTNYYVSIYACPSDEKNCSDASFIGPIKGTVESTLPVTPPTQNPTIAPSSVIITGVNKGASQMTVSWNYVSGATTYFVLWSGTNGDNRSVHTSSNSISFNTIAGVTYYITIYAGNSANQFSSGTPGGPYRY